MKRLCRSLLLLSIAFGPAFGQQFPNVRVSLASSTSPEEVTIAVNPTDPLNLIAGANIRFNYYSTNGGYNWTQGQLPSGTWGDPRLIFDRLGNAYYAHLSNPQGGYFIERLIVHRSSNGGRTWYDSVDVGYRPPKQQDKEWLIADMTNSPYRDNVYMTWTEFDSYGSSNPADSSRILFSRSTDQGSSWSSPITISDRSGDCVDEDTTVEGAVPAVGPNGHIYTCWSGPLGLMFDKSTDGGLTWGTDVFVSSQPGGWDFGIPGIYRCNGLPITVCDISNSPHRGTIYVNWSDQRNGLDDTDVFLSKSTDGGSTWSPATRVNNDLTSRHQFFTWMTIDQSNGTLYIVFYDRRNSVSVPNATDVFVAKSTDGGTTFENFQVSASPFTPISSVFFGDYIGIAAMNSKIYPIWTRMEGTALSVWTAIIRDSTTVSVIEGPPTVARFQLHQNYPNPFNPTTTIVYDLYAEGFVELDLFNVFGQKVSTLVSSRKSAGTHQVALSTASDGRNALASGVYFYRLSVAPAGSGTGRYTETRRLVLLK